MQDLIKYGYIKSLLPKERNGKVADEDLATLLLMHYDFRDDGKVYENGNLIADSKSLNPLPPDEVVRKFCEEKGVLNSASAEPEAKQLNTFSAFEARWKEENPNGNTMSNQFSTALIEHTKKVKDFKFYE